ncbi:MAG: hypothetical protein E4G90_00880 [Gemmatimonadales bacterium]|jgi:hypothetical protein|nr:MAG: hypothetical protein E4G90_00880 [Gemmatimonadales bacterium]
MKYFHRTSIAPDQVIERAAAYFGARLTPTEETARRRRFSGTIGTIGVSVQAEGGHYTLIVIDTDQPGESELDKFAKRFLTMVHTMADPTHEPRGAY